MCNDGGYFGNHCEHERPCRKLRGDLGDIWAIRSYANDEILAYERPTYSYEGGFTVLPDDERYVMAYTGSRWFAMRVNGKFHVSKF